MIRRKATETKTLTPNFASGNVDVTPSANKTMTKVTIQKDADLIASNVKKNIEIHGITGSYEGGTSTGDYEVRFQYLTIGDGKLINQIDSFWTNAGESITPPTISSSLDAVSKVSPALTLNNSSFAWNILTRVYVPNANSGTIGVSINEATWVAYSVIVTNGAGEYRFAYTTQWDLTKKNGSNWDSIASNITLSNYGLVIANGSAASGDYIYVNYKDWGNIQSDLEVGASYNTTDGKTHLFIENSTTTTLNVTLYLNKSDTSTVTVNWGDGTSNSNSTSSGNINITHTYAASNVYEATIWISSGTGTYSLGNSPSDDVLDPLSALLYCYMGANTGLLDYSFYNHAALELCTVSSSITSIPASCFRGCKKCEYVYLPKGITAFGANSFQTMSDLQFLSLPSSLTSIGIYSFQYDYNLEKLQFSAGISILEDYVVSSCSGIKKLIIPKSITAIDTYAISYLYNLDTLNILEYLGVTFGANALYSNANLKSIRISSSTTDLSANLLGSCTAINSITLKRYTAPSTITTLANGNAFTNLTNFRIYVPVGSGDVYKAATNWSSYATRIYEDTAQNRALFGD